MSDDTPTLEAPKRAGTKNPAKGWQTRRERYGPNGSADLPGYRSLMQTIANLEQAKEAAEAENARMRAVHAKAVEQIETFLVTDDDNGMALLLSISALLAPPAETDHE